MVQSKIISQFQNIIHFFFNSNDNIFEFVNSNSKILYMNQVHSNKSIMIKSNDNSKHKCDSLVTKERLFLAVVTADCLPIVLYSENNGYIGIVHAGWRGLFSGIIENTLNQFSRNGANLAELACAIGPHICKNCYDIPRERRDYIINIDIKNKQYITKKSDKIFLDLTKIALHKLVKLGLSSQNIDIINECTSCNKDYNSYHRDKVKSIRQISLIGKKYE